MALEVIMVPVEEAAELECIVVVAVAKDLDMIPVIKNIFLLLLVVLAEMQIGVVEVVVAQAHTLVDLPGEALHMEVLAVVLHQLAEMGQMVVVEVVAVGLGNRMIHEMVDMEEME